MQRVGAMDASRDVACQRALCFPRFGPLPRGAVQRFDLAVVEQREEPHHLPDVTIVGVDPELIEAVRRRALRIEPHGAGGGLAVFGAVGFREQGKHEAPYCRAELFARHIGADGDVAPLICGANLQLAIKGFAQVKEIEPLQQHVAELGITDP